MNGVADIAIALGTHPTIHGHLLSTGSEQPWLDDGQRRRETWPTVLKKSDG